ncbi:thiamine phosphate synthase [Microaerobacter geothermalis]|uniref:thiamine phosphate synthase n=1 Tax=Microaerobacter geothermalis TaxID=674972 RepID=UPI001F3CE64A|nr:thiamine phosphate synthase [Microaerobacter geothermalis]MCF6092596.1 thiamine phosphate synthase [Microaerobacter geothermalis]
MEKMKDLLKVYLVMGSVNCINSPEKVLLEAIEGGITLFQYREKGSGALEGIEKYRLGKRLQQICKKAGIPFIVNDDVELALLLDADGVHIGQDDGSVEKVRMKIGSKILGVSAHNLEEAKEAVSYGADYLGVGPMYTTKTKEDAKEVQGPQGIRFLRENGIDIPIVGIGGITADNAKEVIQAGADGIAVISAITQNSSPRKGVEQLRERV